MGDNKVSEKAIWEGSIPSEDENTQFTTPIQSQPQMMFCHKCNNVIPSNSRYCPYCQVELFTTCPKCGVKYSSQYPACSQCGTNRQEYLQAQRREQERKEAQERENRRQREIQERKRLEEEQRRKKEQEERERQERLKALAQQAEENLQKEAYLKKNDEIMHTQEYIDSYSLLSMAIEDYEKRLFGMDWILVPLFVIIIMVALFLIHPILGFILMITLPFLKDKIDEEIDKNKFKKKIQKYISNSNKNNNLLVTSDLIDMISYQGKERLSECCIIAYREKHGLNVNYKWHNLKRDKHTK